MTRKLERISTTEMYAILNFKPRRGTIHHGGSSLLSKTNKYGERHFAILNGDIKTRKELMKHNSILRGIQIWKGYCRHCGSEVNFDYRGDLDELRGLGYGHYLKFSKFRANHRFFVKCNFTATFENASEYIISCESKMFEENIEMRPILIRWRFQK